MDHDRAVVLVQIEKVLPDPHLVVLDLFGEKDTGADAGMHEAVAALAVARHEPSEEFKMILRQRLGGWNSAQRQLMCLLAAVAGPALEQIVLDADLIEGRYSDR